MKKLDPQRREELIFDIQIGTLGTMALARKFNLAASTISGYRARVEKNNEKELANPRMKPGGGIEIPPGLDPLEWMERVRDCAEAPWDARKSCGIAIYKSENTVSDDKWTPATDPDLWAQDLFLLVLGQSPEVTKAVLQKLIEATKQPPEVVSVAPSSSHNQS